MTELTKNVRKPQHDEERINTQIAELKYNVLCFLLLVSPEQVDVVGADRSPTSPSSSSSSEPLISIPARQ